MVKTWNLNRPNIVIDHVESNHAQMDNKVCVQRNEPALLRGMHEMCGTYLSFILEQNVMQRGIK